MTSQVLYRKWRPQRLDQVVGQGPITQTLRYALATGRVAHAYLFCGPRGTGKTSTARILAKAVNCLEPQEGEPCDRCALCREANEGAALDIIEMDAASNRGIDEVRELRERVHHSPTRGRYKTYIVDEVHMLTEPAFNALLKTLEEPPPHVIFILATTDPQKVPATVISRCQRFDFRRLSPGDIVLRLRQICSGEAVEAETGALEVIARSSWGSLRDATNILEQAIISNGTLVTGVQVRELLGVGDDERALQVVAFALEGRVGQGLAALNAAASEGVDLRRFHKSMVEYLRAVLLAKAQVVDATDYPPSILEQVAKLGAECSLPRIYQVLRAFAQAAPRQESPSPLSLELALVECNLPPEGAVSQGEPAREPLPKAAPVQPDAGRGAPSRKPRTPERPLERAPAQSDAGPGAPVPVAPPKPLAGAEARTSVPETPARSDAGPGARRLAAPQEPLVRASTSEAPAPPGASAPGPVAPPEPLAEAVARPSAEAPAPVQADRWTQMLGALRGQKGRRYALDGILRSSKSHRLQDQVLIVEYAYQIHMTHLQEELDDPAVRQRLAEAVQQAFGEPLELRPVLLPQGEKSSSGHLVRAAQQLGGRVVSQEELTSQGGGR